MRLTQLAVFHPVVALTVTFALIIFGIAAYFTLGLELNPQVQVPIVTVNTPYPGASAEAVEQDVTRPIEDAVVGVGNVKTMTSTSQTSLSTLTVEFQEGVNIDVAASDVQQRVSRMLSTLPDDVEEPSYAKLDLNDVPVLNLAVSGPPGGDPTELYRVANDIARPALETSPGVGRVVVVGGQKPEVHVEVPAGSVARLWPDPQRRDHRRPDASSSTPRRPGHQHRPARNARRSESPAALPISAAGQRDRARLRTEA